MRTFTLIAALVLAGVSADSLAQAYPEKPGRLNCAFSGNGSAPHLAGVLFTRLAGIDMVHVPFKGGGPTVQLVLAAYTQFTIAMPPAELPLASRLPL